MFAFTKVDKRTLDQFQIIGIADFKGHESAGYRVNNSRAISHLIISIWNIGDISEEHFQWFMKPEFSFQPVGTEIPFQQFPGGAAVIVGLSDRTDDSVLPFKPSDLLDTELFAGDLLHHHVNHPCAFGVFITVDHLADQFNVLLILFIFSFPEETVIRLLQAAVERRF